MATPVADPLTSPTSSNSLASSFEMLPSQSPSQETTASQDSDDEIVYSISEDTLLSLDEISDELASDDDFVVLSRPRSPRAIMQTGYSTPDSDNNDRTDTPIVGYLASDLERLSIKDLSTSRIPFSGPPKKHKVHRSHVTADAGAKKTRKRKTARTTAAAATPHHPSSSSSTKAQIAILPPRSALKVKTGVKEKSPRHKKQKRIIATGLGARSIVDDVSEKLSEGGEIESVSATGTSVYEEAVGFITSFLSNPAARKNSACRLTLLQALIIELGLASSSLPASLSSAKAFLKTRAFLNIREYLAVRDQGPAAVQRIMHPNRNALIKDIKKNKDRAPLDWVKDSGLQVLLVKCYH